RRHTRFSRDWSSDVCSSDLDLYRYLCPRLDEYLLQENPSEWPCRVRMRYGSFHFGESDEEGALDKFPQWERMITGIVTITDWREIGRASCRERVERWREERC